MKNHDKHFKGFVQLSRAWYGEANLTHKSEVKDEVTFGYYSPDGGTSGEMSVRWIRLEGRFVPELKIFSDAWSALSNMHDLIDFLGEHDDEDPTPEEFCEYLKQCGFIDKTEEKNPCAMEASADPEYEEYLRLKEKFGESGITLTKRPSDYHACLENHPEIWGCGKSVYEAVGSVIMSHPKKFNLKIDENF